MASHIYDHLPATASPSNLKSIVQDLAAAAKNLTDREADARKAANRLAILYGVGIPRTMQQVVMLLERAVGEGLAFEVDLNPEEKALLQ